MPTYKRISKIGQGGFGEVWRCTRDGGTEQFAMKRILPDANANAADRFAREVRILAKLDHPNVIRILGQRLSEKPYFYIMPLYRRALASEVPTLAGDEARIKIIVGGILDGMEYAHGQGVLHRDLNPRNILMNSDADLVISDFGLGRDVDSDSSRKTFTGDRMGTFLYMAPEQMSDAKNVDRRADVYSVGRIIYELFTGSLTSVDQDLSTLPPGIALIVARCTHRNPSKRFEGVSELKRAWNAYFDDLGKAAGPDELRELVATSSATGDITDEAATRIGELVEQIQTDSDLLEEVIMGLSAENLARVWESNKPGVAMALEKFLDYITEQSWPFGYTDRLASQIYEIYEIIPDYELRAKMVVTLLELGVSHNRFNVLDTFSSVLERERGRSELAVLVAALGQVSTGLLSGAKAYINLKRLPLDLRRLFAE